MSVLIADLKVYQGIASKMFDASFRTTCDINFFSSCHSFKEPLTEAKIWQIVSTWLELNELSYDCKYGKDEEENTVICPRMAKLLKKRFIEYPNTYQFLKWLQCVQYNIEVTTIQKVRVLTEWETYCMEFLNKLTLQAAQAIIDSLPQYKAAKWSEA